MYMHTHERRLYLCSAANLHLRLFRIIRIIRHRTSLTVSYYRYVHRSVAHASTRSFWEIVLNVVSFIFFSCYQLVIYLDMSRIWFVCSGLTVSD